MNALLARLRDAFRRRSIARQFAEERLFHVDELEARHRERGASAAEARQAAERDFGNTLSTGEALRSQAGFPRWDELANDLRQAARGLSRRPWFAGSVVVILGLGLGAAATIHGLIDTVFLRPLAVPHPEQLYAVVCSDPSAPDRLSRGTVRRLEALLPPRSIMAYGGGGSCTVQIGAQAGTVANVRLVTGSFFSVLGIAPAAGRLLEESDDVLGAPTDVVVVSSAWARKNFGTPESALGRVVLINRVPISVIGVLPETFREIAVGQRTEFWFAAAAQLRLGISGNSSRSEGNDRPNNPDWNREERVSWLQILLRVRPGDPLPARALQLAWEPQRDDLLRSDDDPEEQARLNHRGWLAVSAPGGRSRFRDHFHSTGWLLGGVVAVMLVLVCTNVSGFLLVRSMSRHREIGVRLALGAGPFRVVRLGLFEAAYLSAAGSLVGWLLAMGLLPAAVRLLAPGRDLDVGLGYSSILVMAALALFSAVLSALAPALWIARVQPLNALRGNRGLGNAPIKVGRILIVAQFALAVSLVAVATALGEELQRSLAADPGFAREHVETALFSAPDAGFRPNEVFPLMERLRAAALSLPQVKDVSYSYSGILAGSESVSDIFVRDPRARLHQWKSQHDSVSSGYFSVVGIPLLRGREFAEVDRAGSQQVALVNASFAREVFGDLDPIGQALGSDVAPSKTDRTIVGVVADVHMNGVREQAPPMYYMPMAQDADEGPHFLAIRYSGPAAGIRETLRKTLADAAPALVLTNWMTLSDRMADDMKGDLATTRLASIFGGCAVLLAGIGIAASLGYLVVIRQRELALRMAIGASPGQLLRGVLGDSLRLSALGSAVGVVAIWLLPKVPAIGAVLNSRPGIASALVASLIALATALVAGYIPARRAARIDPIQMLKSE
jgi:predicted permease